MNFPFPFTILAALIGLGLIIAELMKNQTEFTISLLAFVDFVLKLNWIFLLAYLLIGGQYYISSLVIACSLFVNLLTNLVIWRYSFLHNRFWEDPKFKNYVKKFPKLSGFLYLMSITFSFHLFKLTYSRLLGKKCFMATFSRKHNLQRILNQITVFSLIFQSLPALAANIYNLFYVTST